MGLAVTPEELRELMASVAFTKLYGFTLAEIGEGECTLQVPFQPLLERPGGIVAGQVFMAAADVAMWFAIMTRFGREDTSVTAEMTTSFLSPARKEGLVTRARIIKAGHTRIVGLAESRTGPASS
jgi:acyl-coenzyme A thioesterase PaaI-like protein